MAGLIYRRPLVSVIASLARAHRSQLIALTMLALTAIIFEVNGRAPGGVNLRPQDRSETVTLAGERLASRPGPGSC